MSELQALIAGFAFYLILEGLLPFFNPNGFKRMAALIDEIEEGALRKFGAVMLILGVILLFSVK